ARARRPSPEPAGPALGDAQLRRNLAKATGTIRAKRAAVVGEVPDWAELRAAGAAIKDQVLANLDGYLVQLEEQVGARGGAVPWARDATEANRVVADLVRSAGADEVVKVKSMVTQEIGLNEALAEAGIAAWETDLAELIVQLGHDSPSHILVPAIHRNRAEIREIFLREMAPVALPAPPGPRRRRPACPCGASSSRPGWPSRGPTSPWPRPAPWSWSSPRATAACACTCPGGG